MQSFTFQPNSTFQYSLLPTFAEALGVTYKINKNDLSITFSSNNPDYLEECWDQLYGTNFNDKAV